METNLKFNSAICTSREQSERLLALGLKRETADMFLHPAGTAYATAYCDIKDKMRINPYIPAWSLHRLIEILDIWYLDLDFHNFDNAYEQVISYFEERVKGGFINKEYLEE